MIYRRPGIYSPVDTLVISLTHLRERYELLRNVHVFNNRYPITFLCASIISYLFSEPFFDCNISDLKADCLFVAALNIGLRDKWDETIWENCFQQLKTGEGMDDTSLAVKTYSIYRNLR